jgi:outer membrane protein assembly factor BamB
MKNIEYIGKGYDIVLGNPQCDAAGCVGGYDPGWANTMYIIDMVYDDGKTSPDGRILVPRGFELEMAVDCLVSSSAHTVHDTHSYQTALNVDASASGGGGFLVTVQATASVDYSTTASTLGSSTKTQYKNSGVCLAYHALAVDPALFIFNLTDVFTAGVAGLPSTYDSSAYLDFVRDFGTHYTSEMLFGAKFVRTLEFDTADSDNLTAQGVNVQAAVKVDALLAHVSASANVTWHKQDHDAMNQFTVDRTELYVGLAPTGSFSCTSPCSPTDVNTGPWQQALLSDAGEPMPVQYMLTQLDKLLTTKQFPQDTDILAKQANLAQFLEKDYCGKLASKGCAPPNPLGFWATEPPTPAPRIGAASVALGGAVMLVVGGMDAAGASSRTVSRFANQDGGIGWLSPLADMPTPRHYLTVAVSEDDFVYAVGGMFFGELDTIEQLSVGSNVWTTKRSMPTPRYSLASAALPDGNIYVVGGNTQYGPTAIMESYSPDNDAWSTEAPMSVPREGLCAGVINGQLFVTGGYNGSDFLASVEVYNAGNRTWTTVAPMAHARSGHACAVVDDVLVVYGGRNAAGVLSLVEAYSPNTNTWIRRTSAAQALWLASAAMLDDQSDGQAKMFVVGGTGDVFVKWRHACVACWGAGVLSSDAATLYIGSYEDTNVYALNTADGSVKWQHATGSSVKAAGVLSSGGSTLYIGSVDKNVYALNTADGSVKWQHATGGSQCQPGVAAAGVLSSDGATLYIGSLDGNVYALNTADGSVKWQHGTCCGLDTVGVLSSDGATLYIGTGYSGDGVAALNTADGSLKWSLTAWQGATTGVLSSDGATLYISGGDTVFAVNTADGSIKWQYDAAGQVLAAGVLSSDGSTLYIGSDNNVDALNTAGAAPSPTFTAFAAELDTA